MAGFELRHQVWRRGQGHALTPGFLLTDQNRFLVATPEGDLSPRGKLIVNNKPDASPR
jgi:hypothetical protein